MKTLVVALVLLTSAAVSTSFACDGKCDKHKKAQAAAEKGAACEKSKEACEKSKAAACDKSKAAAEAKSDCKTACSKTASKKDALKAGK